MIIHTQHIAVNLPKETLVAKQQPTNNIINKTLCVWFMMSETVCVKINFLGNCLRLNVFFFYHNKDDSTVHVCVTSL